MIVAWYARVLSKYPSIVLLLSGSISCILTGFSVWNFINNTPSFDPQMGFESRGTEYSGRILAWELLEDSSVWQNVRQISEEKPYARRGKRDANSSQEDESNDQLSIFANKPSGGIRGKPRTTRPSTTTTTTTTTTATPLKWAKAFIDVVAAVPCQQMKAAATNDKVKDIMPYLSKLVYSSPSLDSLFTLSTFQELCSIHEVSHTFRVKYESRLKDAAQLTHLFSLANYAVCGSNASFPNNCTQLTQDDVDSFRIKLVFCSPHREALDKCRHDPYTKECFAIPEECHNDIIVETFFRAISIGAFENPNSPVFVAVTLPIPQHYAHYFKFHHYDELRDAVLEHSSKLTTLKLVGMEFDTKLHDFYNELTKDMVYGEIALGLIVVVTFLYSMSGVYMIAVALCVVFSLTNAYFLYTFVFGIDFFPFMNLLVFVLLVGIGADDTFVLKHIFDESLRLVDKTRPYSIPSPRVQPSSLTTDQSPSTVCATTIGDEYYKEKKTTPTSHADPLAEAIERTLRHACVSMFVTSATTAVAFYANVVNNVICIRCFGIFAGSTMMVNYVMVVTWLPATLVIMHKYCRNNWCSRKLNSKLCNLSTLYAKLSTIITSVIQNLVSKLYILWILFGISLFIASLCAIFIYPKLQLPNRNPLQVFGKNHPYEWYSDQAQLLFPFAGLRNEEPIFVDITWGFKPNTDAPLIEPRDKGQLQHTEFNLTTVKQFMALADLQKRLSNMTSLGIVDQPLSNYFLPKFLTWSSNQQCKSSKTCCNIQSPYFVDDNLASCINQASRKSGMVNYKRDTPVLVNDDTHNIVHVIGYTTRYATNLTYSPVYTTLNSFITMVDRDVANVMVEFADDYANVTDVDVEQLTSAWALPVAFDVVIMARWYSLLHAVLTDTPLSIGISVSVAAVVVVFVTRQIGLAILCMVNIVATITVTVASIALLGWPINLVESTIIILTVGLSFDFTLHMAVAYKQCSHGQDDGDRVGKTIAHIGHPVLLATITTVIAGLAMSLSTTLAFHQIGVFMMLVTVASYLYAQFVFCSALILLKPVLTWTDCD